MEPLHPPMKRSRDPKDTRAAVGNKKSKSIQACMSCRKHKTRCEILNPGKSPVRCHRCQVLALQCSYEEAITPTASTSRLPSSNSESPEGAKTRAPKPMSSQLPPKDRLWSFVEHAGMDWSAPMLAIQQLSKLPHTHLHPPERPPPVLPPGELILMRIISEEQIRYLLDLFDERYTPWLNFKPATRMTSSLLDAVCCAIAARHLDDAADIKAQLQTLTEDSIARLIFNPRPSESVEAIQALLILSLWTPLGGPPEDSGRDGRLLIASAVSMAMNLRLNQASKTVAVLRAKNDGLLSAEDAEALEAALQNARLWISLTNTESMLCLGTGRVPLSRRSPEDLQLIDFPQSFDGLIEYGDVRLGIAASAFDLLEQGVGSRLQPGGDMDTWYDGITVVLEKLKRVKRLITPLPYVLERDQFYFHILHVYEGMARLLVLYFALWDARLSVAHIPQAQWWHPQFKPHSAGAVGEWGRDMVQTTEALLVSVLAADARHLGTAPDTIFTMVALAAGYVVGIKFLMLRGGIALIGASDLLLARIVSHLGDATCTPGHAAQRSAFLVMGMIARWEGRAGSTGAAVPASYPTPISENDASKATPSPSNFFEPSAFVGSAGMGTGTMLETDFNLFMDSTIPMDPNFWNNFMQTQAELVEGYP